MTRLRRYRHPNWGGAMCVEIDGNWARLVSTKWPSGAWWPRPRWHEWQDVSSGPSHASPPDSPSSGPSGSASESLPAQEALMSI